MQQLWQEVRDDPAGAGLAVLIPALLLLACMLYLAPAQLIPRHIPVTLESPPEAWRQSAPNDDVLDVPGHQVAYWGKANATYGISATRHKQRFQYLIIHYTAPRPILNLVKYQHNGDDERGGSFGYHIYVDRDGNIVQGAPLSKRTNHLKPAYHRARKHVAVEAESSNSIGITLVGACHVKHPGAAVTRCTREDVTQEQLAAGVDAAHAILSRYGIPCSHIYGHGDLQRDRSSFEGSTLTAALREECSESAIAAQ